MYYQGQKRKAKGHHIDFTNSPLEIFCLTFVYGTRVRSHRLPTTTHSNKLPTPYPLWVNEPDRATGVQPREPARSYGAHVLLLLLRLLLLLLLLPLLPYLNRPCSPYPHLVVEWVATRLKEESITPLTQSSLSLSLSLSLHPPPLFPSEMETRKREREAEREREREREEGWKTTLSPAISYPRVLRFRRPAPTSKAFTIYWNALRGLSLWCAPRTYHHLRYSTLASSILYFSSLRCSICTNRLRVSTHTSQTFFFTFLFFPHTVYSRKDNLVPFSHALLFLLVSFFLDKHTYIQKQTQWNHSSYASTLHNVSSISITASSFPSCISCVHSARLSMTSKSILISNALSIYFIIDRAFWLCFMFFEVFGSIYFLDIFERFSRIRKFVSGWTKHHFVCLGKIDGPCWGSYVNIGSNLNSQFL